MSDSSVTLFAHTDFRGERKLFGIRRQDRRHHVYVIGKTGAGKSTLLETLITQDIAAGEGAALVDPHGDLVERVYAQVPSSRVDDVTYLDVGNLAQPYGFNPLANVPPEKRPLAAGGLLEACKKLWADSWGPRLEHILRNALLALLDQPEATLADVLQLLHDADFRRDAASRVQNKPVRRFWLREFEGYTARFRTEAIAPIENKVGAFLANPLLFRILTQPDCQLNLRSIMDEGKVLLVNLAKGRVGEDAAALLGALLVAGLGTAAFGRAELPEHDRRDFSLFLDEFPLFTTLSLANMLSELRKYRVSLVLAHQYLSQLDEPMRDAILGNAGTQVVFRVGITDAEVLAREFYPAVSEIDLVSLPNHHFYVRLMVNGLPTEPFSAETLPPLE